VAEKPAIYLPTDPVARIVTIRGQKVILDSDLAAIYGVETKRLNEQVKRNADRFPPDFMFQLMPGEFTASISQSEMSKSQPIGMQADNVNRSQFATGSSKHRDPRLDTEPLARTRRNLRPVHRSIATLDSYPMPSPNTVRSWRLPSSTARERCK
jgi:hypothetical protein